MRIARTSLFALAKGITATLGIASLGVSSTAFAGGFGLMGLGGVHTDTVYFYDSSNNMAQIRQTQTLPQYGVGGEFLLGDRDDRIIGVFRGYWMQDAPQQDPAERTKTVAPENVVAAVRTEPKNIGAASFGVQWGLWGDPEKLMVTGITAVGSGFLTTDHTEFMMLQLGGGATYAFRPDMQVFADVNYTGRYRKNFSNGVTAYAGVRYLFD
jgi:hypothetical protein